MISYDQKTGTIEIDGASKGWGYSGFGVGLNNPNMESVPDIGPIPAGQWKIDRWEDHHAEKGPQVAVLSPVGHTAHGRSGFLIHGDNVLVNHTASHGCIIANRAIRDELRASGETELLVTHADSGGLNV